MVCLRRLGCTCLKELGSKTDSGVIALTNIFPTDKLKFIVYYAFVSASCNEDQIFCDITKECVSADVGCPGKILFIDTLQNRHP